jgi:hypothetical protein
MCSNIVSCQSFKYLIKLWRQKTLKCAWQDFGTQSSFWIKVKLDPIVRWKGLDEINVHKIYNYIF